MSTPFFPFDKIIKEERNLLFEWFAKKKFETNDLLRILKLLAESYPRCGVFLLFGSCFGQWENIQNQIAMEFKIIGFVDLDFNEDYIAFENLLHELYCDPLWQDSVLMHKIRLLKTMPLQVRVILLTNDNDDCTVDAFYDSIRNFQQQMFNANDFETDNVQILMQSTDTREEFVRVKNIILSPNNILNLTRRISRDYSKDLVTRINRAKVLLDKNCIHHEDIVVVGSSVLEVFGIRQAIDLDIAVRKSYRERWGNDYLQWEDDIEYIRLDSIVHKNGIVYPDDVIIDDDNLHFMFYGLKFLNLELLKGKKEHDWREKDIQDIKLIEVFQNYKKNCNTKLN